MYLMPLFVKKKKKRIKNQHISFEHCNQNTGYQTVTFLYTHHLSIFSSLIHQFLCTTSKIVNIFASLSIHSFHIHKSDQFVNCY